MEKVKGDRSRVFLYTFFILEITVVDFFFFLEESLIAVEDFDKPPGSLGGFAKVSLLVSGIGLFLMFKVQTLESMVEKDWKLELPFGS